MKQAALPVKGRWRRFGPFGPAYEILHEVRALSDGDKVIVLRVVDTGEELEYRLSDALRDPEAA